MNLDNATATSIRSAVNTLGTYDPDDVMPMIEEQLTQCQFDVAEGFLNYCHVNNKKFGSNIQEVFAIYKLSTINV